MFVSLHCIDFTRLLIGSKEVWITRIFERPVSEGRIEGIDLDRSLGVIIDTLF